jgi:acyl CoA:acetate/3-ketoacid CoA transferase alpha subunit
MSPGAPKGNRNALKHGRCTAEAIARRREIALAEITFHLTAIEPLGLSRQTARFIRERVVAGMARAKAKGTESGKLIGRLAIHRARLAAFRAAYEAGGVGLRAVAAQFGVGVETVRRCVG